MKEDLKEQFWTQIKAGNEKAFCELYEQYADMLYGYGMRIIADDIIVNNAIQSLFVYLFEKRHNLSVPNSINAYLCVSLKRLILLDQKNENNSDKVPLDNISVSEYDFDLEIDVERTIINAEYKRDLADTLQKAMSKLTGKQKEIIYLKYYKGMSNSEMVIATGLNIQTVKNLASQAISRLREIKELANVYAPFLLLVILLILSL